ncbi:Neuronal acetylcholine receptor subunit alpha-9-I [Dissostichus eleginoides]|uniref:Neuronal acetylcholine receptor subunit alpha-9-I n=1 Tax=Dissostichus eleginoides TaxID=100907 RepID=A0AAD9BNF5_DISEL|nr:Neuronal acetylcholine receptor subunit alpha-9-I [Dissostichus eleginoides]
MRKTALMLWISLLVQVSHGAQGQYARKLLTDLMEDYSNALRPVEDTDAALNVSLQITLSQIKDMDEKNQVLTTYLWIRLVWHDAYLKWDKEDYDDLEMINIPSDLVWKPDIVLYNKSVDIRKYYIATMTMITASTSLTIFIMNIHFCGAEAKPVPHWAKVLIIDYMSKIFFVYEVGENCTTPASERTPLYPEEPASDDHIHDYHHDNDRHQYSNCHAMPHPNKHHKVQANGNANNSRHHYNNHNNHTSGLERGEGKTPQRYQHIRRDELDYQASPRPQNLQQLNGGLKEQFLYPPEKVPACPCCCPCLQHKQLVKNIQYIANCFREQRATCVKAADWKKVAKVMDRFFMWIFFIMVFLMSILIIAKAS